MLDKIHQQVGTKVLIKPHTRYFNHLGNYDGQLPPDVVGIIVSIDIKAEDHPLHVEWQNLSNGRKDSNNYDPEDLLLYSSDSMTTYEIF